MKPTAPALTITDFGTLPDGRTVRRYTLANATGVTVELLDYGATLHAVRTPDRSGEVADIVLGFESLAGYLSAGNPYFGCIAGRFANRIAKGRFTLEGKTYQLPINNGENSLHGGLVGFDKLLWSGTPLSNTAVAFTLVSPDGDQGYPGTLTVVVTYSLDDTGALRIDYQASTDKTTVINLTNHVYFNLAGHNAGGIGEQTLQLAADFYTPVNEHQIPTGELLDVEGTAFDFRSPARIGARIIETGGDPYGYDHNFVFNKGLTDVPLEVGSAVDPESGRRVTLFTTEPAVQFYSGNFLDGTLVGKGGAIYPRRAGFCLETQHYPDSPNRATFPSTVLKPGRTFRSTTIYRFGLA